jgi:hypothetical protein
MTKFVQNAEIAEKRFIKEKKTKNLFIIKDNNEFSCFYLSLSYILSSTH